MGAAESHRQKLDRIQQAAEALGCFATESLQSRREAACLSLACKLLSGNGRGILSNYTPTINEVEVRSRHQLNGTQISMPVASNSQPLDIFSRSFLCKLPAIWPAIPQERVSKHKTSGWRKLPKALGRFEKAKSESSHCIQQSFSINEVGT
jgi:hypothetical protein